MTQESQTLYWFEPPTGALSFGDGRKPKIGTTHRVKGPVRLCGHGLHASARVLDAAGYARSPILWGVRLRGEIRYDEDKAAATEREYVWRFDTTEIMDRFARLAALDVIRFWDAPSVVVRFLLTGNPRLRDDANQGAVVGDYISVLDGLRAAKAADYAAAAAYCATNPRYADAAYAAQAANYAALAAYADSYATSGGVNTKSARAAEIAASEKYEDWLEQMVREAAGA